MANNAQPWYLYKQSQGFTWTPQKTKNHSGIDLACPLGTPFTSPVAGTIVGASCHPWGIQVDIRFSAAGGDQLVFSGLHLMQLADGVKVGNVVQPGTLLGYTGGVSSGVPCPTERKYSSGAHLHVELTHGPIPPYTTYNPRRPTGTSYPINPGPMLQSLRTNNGAGVSDASVLGYGLGILGVDANGLPIPVTASDYQSGNTSLGIGSDSEDADPGAGNVASQMLAEFPGFFGLCAALDTAMQFSSYSPPGGLTGTLNVPGYTTKWIVKNSIAMFSRLTIWTLGVFLLLAIFAAMVNINKWLNEAGGIVLPLAIAAM